MVLMPRKSTTEAMFTLRMLMEKYREGQNELHCQWIFDRGAEGGIGVL